MKLFKPNIQRLAKTKNVHALIKVLKDSGWDTSIRLAAVSALGEMSDLQAVEALSEALKDSDSGVRQAASATLDQLGYTRSLEPLVIALRDNDSGVRQQATEALSQLGWQPVDKTQSALLAVAQQNWDLAVSLGSVAVEPLIAALTDPNDWVRQQATAALISLGSPAVEPLIAALRDYNSGVRQQAAEILGRLGDPRALAPLIAALRDDNSGVHEQAAAALGRLGDPHAVEPLVVALRDNDSKVRQQAAGVLGQLGWQPVDKTQSALLAIAQQNWYQAVSLGSVAVEPLIATFTDPNDWVRQQATAALVNLGSVAVEPLVIALRDNDSLVRQQAAEILGRLGDPHAVEPLVAALRDNDGKVRQQAAEALSQLSWQPVDKTQSALLAVAQQNWDLAVSLGSVAVEPLIAALTDPNDWVRQQATAALVSLGSVAVEPLIAALLKDYSSLVRQHATAALVSLGSPAVEPLVIALRDNNGRIRWQAAAALGRLGDPRAVEPLIAILTGPNDWVRRQAAEALGRLGNPRAVEPLVIALRDNDGWVRRQAAEALSQLNWQPVDKTQSALLAVAQQNWDQAVNLDSAAVEPLMAALTDDWVRGRAIAALVNLGSAAVEPLVAALEDTDSRIREQAAEILGRLGDPRAVEPLMAALTDPNDWVREHATDALGRLGDPRAVEPLMAALTDDWVRGHAIAALVNLGSAAVEPLVAALEDTDSRIRWQAAEILGRLGDPHAVEPLVAALEDTDSEVREQAAAALGQLGDPRAVEPLVAVLRDNYRVSGQAVEALASFGLAAVEPLVATLGDTDSGVRQHAAEALGRLGDPRAVEPLVAALRDNYDEWARWQAAAALGRLGNPRAVEPLVAALEDKSSRVREQVTAALGRIGDPRAVKPLLAVFEDNSIKVRAHAAIALGRLGDPRAVGPLLAVLRGLGGPEFWELREQAAEGLGQLGDLRAVEPLIKSLKDSDLDVRQAAARALREIGDPRGVDALRYYQEAAESSERSRGFKVIPTIGATRPSVEVTLSSEERASVEDITQKEASHLHPQLRHLHARYPERVQLGDPIPLQVRVALSPALSKSTPLRAFSIPLQGVDVKLVLDCPGFLLHSASIATVHVVPEADSDWALFELEALHEGVSTLEVSAFHGGAFLGTLSMQLTVDHLAVRGQNVERIEYFSLRSSQEGEVTLVIRYDSFSSVYRYQFRSAFVETDEFRSEPLRRKQEEAIADLIASLNEQARDLTGYSAEETRSWLQGKGIELWNELIPKELQNVFWQHRDSIKCMTILSAGDPMPWEVMYPTNDAGDGAGFLAEQFPVVRWMFGPTPTAMLHCSQPFFVMPEDAPPTAENELTALRQIIGGGLEVNELTPLLSVFDHADFDMLHFACHNIFRSDSPTTSSIQIGSKRFVPTFLSKYKGQFYRRSPLVFLNACRSAGMAANYTWSAGWAKSFLTAGAGAFVGSLWEVRDTSASRFADEFYRALFSGVPLGNAMKLARIAIQNEPSDPTWLAYTLYGNPAAILSKEPPKLG